MKWVLVISCVANTNCGLSEPLVKKGIDSEWTCEHTAKLGIIWAGLDLDKFKWTCKPETK